MEMREYLEVLSEQIRCKAARPAVEAEIRQHIEDQAEAYEADGHSREDAVKMAVKQMGDPVETGVELDRIHRPKTDWNMVALIFALSAAGLCVFGAIAVSTGNWPPFYKRVGFTALGFLVMCLVYRMDYSILGKYPVRVWLGFGILIMLLIPSVENGSVLWIPLFPGLRSNGQIHIYNLLLLFIPLYAAVLYGFRGGRYGAVFGCLMVLIVPVLLGGRAVQSTAAVEIVICCFLLLFVAVWKGWFRVNRGFTLGGLTFGAAVVPVFLFQIGIRSGFLREYQQARIRAFLHMNEFQNSANYLRSETMKLVGDYTLLGNRNLPPDNLVLSRTLDSEFAVTALFYYYGILAGCVVLFLIAWLLIRSCTVCMKQKNRLGMMIGLGCVLALGIQAVTYVLSNFGIGLLTQKTMPFLSSGGQGTVINFIFLGLLLSIYRYKDVLAEEREMKKKKCQRRKLWKVIS